MFPRQSRSDLLTALTHLFDNRCHVIEADQANHVGPTITDRRSPWAGGARQLLFAVAVECVLFVGE